MTDGQPFKSKEELAAAFKAEPQRLVDSLIASSWLRGEIRDWLTELLIEGGDDPALAKFAWLPLMPWYVSIDFCDGPCNLNCRMCSGRPSRPKKLILMTKRQIHKILRNIPTAEMVCLPSGTSDPLMNPDFVETLRMLKERRLPCGLVTNGHLLKPDAIAELAEYPYHVEFNVSIDSADPAGYKVIRGVELAPLLDKLEALMARRKACPSSGFTLNVMMVGMEDNIEGLPEMLELCARLGAKSLKIQHCVGNERPGDMTLNPNWRQAIAKGIEASGRLDVGLMIPQDSRYWEQAKRPAAMETETPSLPGRTAAPAGTVEPSRKIVCPRYDNIQVRTDGRLSPCCHLKQYPKDLNIFDGPLYKNIEYLRYRMHFLAGGVLSACPPAPNCHAMQRRRTDIAAGKPVEPLKFEPKGS